MQNKIRIGIIGGAGYTGGELTRLLLNHPFATIHFIQSTSNAGKKISSVHQDLIGETEMVFSASHAVDVDLIFLCAGHGEGQKFVSDHDLPESVRIIDIGNDFRLAKDASIKNRTFIYGLPELNRAAIQTAHNIANPGCFATAIQLGLLPLAKEKLLQDIYTTGITGSTGAGQALSPTSHFSWRSGNIQAYKTLEHQHLDEIGESLAQLQEGENINLNFIPWRGDFTRGIFISSQLDCAFELSEARNLYEAFYKDHPFVNVSDDPIHLKQVVNTNKAVIQLEKIGQKLVIHSAIDNLLKGASGQAVQNMNLMFDLPEDTGLHLKANYF